MNGHAIREAAQSGEEPQRGYCPTHAIVRDGHDQHAVLRLDGHTGGRGPRVLRHVGQRLCDDVVRGCLHVWGKPPLGRDEVDGDRRSRGECLERGPEATVREYGGMDSSRELPQFLEGLSELPLRACEQLQCRLAVAPDPRLEQAE